MGVACSGVVDEVPMFHLKEGKKVPYEHWAGTEYVAYYFSASWCPPCRKTTPALVEEYQRMLDAEGMSVEVVLVGADRSEEEMLRYMQNYGMKWPAVQFGHEEMLEGYASRGIPHLVIVDRKTGKALAHGTGVEGIEEVVKKMRVYSGVEGEFQVGSWLEKYGVLVAVLLCGVLIFVLKKSRERRKQE